VSEPKHICAFYSHGPHFVRLLKRVRAEEPGARITAVVPPGFPQDALAGLANRMVFTQRARYRAYDIIALISLVYLLRHEVFDGFYVMFDTAKLRLLAISSGAPQRFAFGPDGQLRRLRALGAGAMIAGLGRRVRGTARYLYILYIVYRYPVETKHSEES